MRVLFTTTPGRGHFHPLLPLARALSTAQHEVAFACAQSLHASVESEGFTAFPAGRWTADHPAISPAGNVLTGYSSRAATASLYVNVMVDTNTRFMTPDVVAVGERWRPDVIVREEMEFGGAVAAEVLGLPHAAVQVLFFYGRTGLERMVSKKLSRIRRDWRLPPDPTLEMLYRYLFLSFTSPSFIRERDAIPPTMHFLQSADARQDTMPSLPWPARSLRRPVIYATLGTTLDRGRALLPGMIPDIFPALIAGLQGIAGTLIVTVGPERDPHQYAPHPSHVYVERYIPNDAVFPLCDLLVTHGGHNTVVPALRHGLPMVLIPFWADQPDNAARCAELGVGRVIEPGEATAERIATVAQEVLLKPGFRQRAEAIRDEMNALPPVEEGVALLERLVSTGRPVTRGAGEPGVGDRRAGGW